MTTRLRALLRLPLIVFFVLTTLFGLLSYVPFTYLQFLRHQLFDWLAFFVLFHHVLYWAAFLLGALSIADDLAARRRSAWVLIGIFSLYGVWLAFHPLLPTLGNDKRSLQVALAALAAPVAFGAIDHFAAGGLIPWNNLEPWAASERARALQMFGGTAAYLWLTFSLTAAYRLQAAGGGRPNAFEFALATLWSLSVHLTVAAGMCLLFAALTLVRSQRARYLLILGSVAMVVAMTLGRVVFTPIAFRGGAATTMALIFGSSAAVIWSGFAHRHAAETMPLGTAMDVAMFRSPRPERSWQAVMALIVLGLVAFTAIEATARVDWYFLQQRLIAFVVWIGGLIAFHRIAGTRRRWISAAAMAVAIAIVSGRFVAAGTPIAARWTLAIDRYAPYDASLMLLQGALTPGSGQLAEVTRFLVAQSNVTDARAASIDFANPVPVSPPQPHIFLFVIDSLRRDYLSPYNPAVTFTPAIQAFADESLTFRRGFTRYSGTGLSEPAMWSGALLPHKEYVTPFAPMNALEKLLVAQRYHRLISVDLILKQLLTPSADVYELDRGIQNRHYQLCRTLAELRAALPGVIRDGRAAFVFTQSQDTHLANVATDRDARSGVTDGAFYRPYAARVQRLDACFGQFIRYLKDAGMYEDSVIVLTSDHGDSLGEEGRWGHAYTVFPEVIQVPLIVHAPAALRRGALVDTDAVAFTTDITPTLYELLGRQPADLGRMFGIPLIGATPLALAKRRVQPYIVASSYGPVYGLLENNGEELYIVDAVNTDEHRYELRRGLNGERAIVTDIERARAIDAIRLQVLELSRFYGVTTAR